MNESMYIFPMILSSLEGRNHVPSISLCTHTGPYIIANIYWCW